MNYKDVALLNGSLDSLGESLLKNKMLAQQKEEAAARTGLESQRLGVDQSFRQAQEKHYQNIEDKIDMKDAFNNMLESGKQLHQGMMGLSEQVRGGMDPDLANEKFRAGLDSVPDALKQKILLDPTMRAAYDGDLDWNVYGAAPSPKDIKPQTFDVGGKRGLYNPGTGSFQITPANAPFSPVDKAELADVNQSLRDIDKETRALAHMPDPDKARALRVQQDMLTKKKQAILGKYSGAPAAADPSAAQGKPIDAQTVAAILQETGGDKDAARALATQRGYTWPTQ
jgi:hypothetical protein